MYQRCIHSCQTGWWRKDSFFPRQLFLLQAFHEGWSKHLDHDGRFFANRVYLLERGLFSSSRRFYNGRKEVSRFQSQVVIQGRRRSLEFNVEWHSNGCTGAFIGRWNFAKHILLGGIGSQLVNLHGFRIGARGTPRRFRLFVVLAALGPALGLPAPPKLLPSSFLVGGILHFGNKMMRKLVVWPLVANGGVA